MNVGKRDLVTEFALDIVTYLLHQGSATALSCFGPISHLATALAFGGKGVRLPTGQTD